MGFQHSERYQPGRTGSAENLCRAHCQCVDIYYCYSLPGNVDHFFSAREGSPFHANAFRECVEQFNLYNVLWRIGTGIFYRNDGWEFPSAILLEVAGEAQKVTNCNLNDMQNW